MFTQILFLILLLFTLSTEPAPSPISWPIGLAIGVGLYLLTLLVMRKTRNTFWAQTQLLLFFLLFHLILFPTTRNLLLSTLSLAAYFFALYVHHRSVIPVRFLLPFCLPFLLFDLVSLGIPWLPDWAITPVVSLIASIIFFCAVIVLFPYVLVKVWGCCPLPDSDIHDRLKQLCKRTRFRCAGLLQWPVMGQTATAAILGLVRWLRFVIFTPRLLQQLQPDEVEAVLAHEIGHHRHRHLLFYPLILLGMTIVLTLYATLLGEPIQLFFTLKARLEPERNWLLLAQLIQFVLCATIVVLYFRFFFGLYSRLFERQADLHVFSAKVQPDALRRALLQIAYLSGQRPEKPSWHHYSVAQRVTFLSQAENNPTLVDRHHRKVRKARWGYLAALLAVGTLLFVPGSGIQQVNHAIVSGVTHAPRTRLVERTIEQWQPVGKKEMIAQAVSDALIEFGIVPSTGVVEFATAKKLLELQEHQAAATFLVASWEVFPQAKKEKAHPAFQQLAHQILPHLSDQLAQQLAEIDSQELTQVD